MAMAKRADASPPSPRRELVAYAILVTLLAAVFYVLGPLLGSLSAVTKSNVPAAALMFVCPTIAAVLLARRSRRTRELMGALRLPRLPWYFWLATVLVLPLAVIWASVLSGVDDFTAPSVLSAGLLAFVYLISALGEEIGWTGYALPRLLKFHGEFASAIALGVFWAAWHIIPFWEAGNSAAWIVGQCLFSVVLRIVLVRLTVLARMSIWPAVVCHAMYNLAWSLSPDAGAHYNPWIVGAVVACAVAFLYLIRSLSPGTRDLRP
jgi:membrane protease YdiL (CAAX protease family)